MRRTNRSRRVRAGLWTTCAAAAALGGMGCDDELGATGATVMGGGAHGGLSAGSGASTTPQPEGGLASNVGPSCDVAPIFAAKCLTCHGVEPIAGAPMSLVSHTDFQGTGPLTTDQPILALIGARIHDPQRPMPPSGGLSDAEKAAIDAWLAAGAPSDQGLGCEGAGGTNGGAVGGASGGDVSGATGGVNGAATGGTTADDPMEVWPPPDADDCFELRAHAEGSSEPHIVRAGTETHPKIVFDAPWGDRAAQVVGFRPITDNARVLHHWILYENTRPGAFITGWAPGNEGSDLPADVGMYVPSGPQSLYLDMHYYNVAGTSDEPDSSGVEVCVAYEPNMRTHTATVFMDFANILGLRLPPQQDTDIVDFCRIDAPGPIATLSVSPHMHELGYHAKLEVQRASTGQVEVWHDGGFAFEDQQIYSLEGKMLQPGDVVKTTCSFRNTTNNTVTFGENTGDEMCFNFVTYYPREGLRCEPNYPGLFAPPPF